jgi:hypothetical protein
MLVVLDMPISSSLWLLDSAVGERVCERAVMPPRTLAGQRLGSRTASLVEQGNAADLRLILDAIP